MDYLSSLHGEECPEHEQASLNDVGAGHEDVAMVRCTQMHLPLEHRVTSGQFLCAETGSTKGLLLVKILYDTLLHMKSAFPKCDKHRLQKKEFVMPMPSSSIMFWERALHI